MKRGEHDFLGIIESTMTTMMTKKKMLNSPHIYGLKFEFKVWDQRLSLSTGIRFYIQVLGCLWNGFFPAQIKQSKTKPKLWKTNKRVCWLMSSSIFFSTLCNRFIHVFRFDYAHKRSFIFFLFFSVLVLHSINCLRLTEVSNKKIIVGNICCWENA